MLYLLCFIPPVAVLLVGRPGTAVLNLFLTLCGYVPGVVHAFLVVGESKADKRMERMVQAISRASGNQPVDTSVSKPAREKSGFLPMLCAFFGGFTVLGLLIAHFQGEPSATTPPPLISPPGLITSPSQALLASQKRAIALYPELAVSGSPINREFLRRYAALKSSDDPLLSDPSWPEKIARLSSSAISAPAHTP